MDWEEVEPAAKAAFRVWVHEGDLAWAEAAWAILAGAGLTAYEDELERHQVVLRFLQLANFYYGFCSVYRSEEREPDF